MPTRTISRDIPLAEITLRKYEKPLHTDKRELVRKLCLSTGLLQPGDSRDIIVDIFYMLLMARKEKKMLSDRTIFQPVVTNNRIRATVIYIDSFGNVITNITKTLFKEIGKTRDFTISFRMPGYNITSISQSYQDVIEGERLALFGSNELLEIAINVGNASELLGINQNDIIIIEFHDN